MKKNHMSKKQLLAYFMAGTVTFSMLEMNPCIATATDSLQILKTEDLHAASLKSISLNHTNYTLRKGKTLRLKVTPSPKKAKRKKIIWKSSKKSIATVSTNGVVKGKKKGTTTITATVKGTKIKASCKIRVGIPVAKIKVSKAKLTLFKGKSTRIKVTISPSNASYKKVAFYSSNKSVATVSSSGTITAKKTGSATISIKSQDGSAKKATVKITVKEKNTETPSFVLPSTPSLPSSASAVPSMSGPDRVSTPVIPSNGRPSISNTASGSSTSDSGNTTRPSVSGSSPRSSEPNSSSHPSASVPVSSTPASPSKTSLPVTPSVSRPSNAAPSAAAGSAMPSLSGSSEKPSTSGSTVAPSASDSSSSTSVPNGNSMPTASGPSAPSAPVPSSSSVTAPTTPSIPDAPSDIVSPSTPSVTESDAKLRFLLTWENNSEAGGSDDLDAHLIGPDASGNGTFHTYYANRTYTFGTDTLVSLQTDDILNDNAETTSIYKMENGVYHFYVYDFSNQRNKANDHLTASGAKVQVLQGDHLLATYEVPQGTGTIWDVCTYDAQTETLTAVNTLSYLAGESTDVGSEPLAAARQRLARCYARYESVDFGSALEEEISQKRNAAKQAMDSTDIDMIEDTIDAFENYFELLEKSTQISDVSGDGLSDNLRIVRQEENRDSKNYSLLYLYGESDTCPTAINVTPSSETASVTLQASDKKEYDLLVLVSDSTTKATEKYYVIYQKNPDQLLPTAVTDAKNTITDFDVDIDEGTDGNRQIHILVSGTATSLLQPQFTFANENITGTYQILEDGTGTLTVTDGQQTVVYPVLYTQTISEIHLLQLQEDENFMLPPEESWDYDDTGIKCFTYTVIGQKASLDPAALCTFNVTPEQYSIHSVTDTPWNYEISVTYQGKTATLYINYIQRADLSILPASGTYESAGETCRFQDISLQKTSSGTALRLTGSSDSLSDISSIRLTGSDPSLTYECRTQNDQTLLSIQQNGVELIQYPIIYEKDISAISYTGISSSDGFITAWDTDYNWDEQDQIYYIFNVYGKAVSLSNLSLVPDTPDAEVSFTTQNAPDGYAGILNVSYKTQTRQYLVFYHQEV